MIEYKIMESLAHSETENVQNMRESGREHRDSKNVAKLRKG